VGGGRMWEGEYGGNYVFMYENGKMRPVESVPGMGKWGTKENDGGLNLTTIYWKNFGKCHNVPPVQQ
jgi:hypothetical protein